MSADLISRLRNFDPVYRDEDIKLMAESADRLEAMEAQPQSGNTISITVGRELFQFASLTQWKNKAQSWFAVSGHVPSSAICVDAKGRICTIGKHFMQADDDNAYPVRVFVKEPE